MSDEADIQALVHLIDDPDEVIYHHVRDRLMNYGIKAVPHLEQAWEEKDFGLTFLQRIEQLTHDIQLTHTKTLLTKWNQSERKDLLEGTMIVTKYHYPNINEAKIYQFFDDLKRNINKVLSHRQSALEKVRAFNKVFFDDYKFRGDPENFYSPLNSYLHTVIDSRKGNPLALGIIYCVVAQSLKLPIYGVNLPNHFVLAYIEKTPKRRFSFWDKTTNKRNVLFYITPFSQGDLFDEHEISSFLQKLNIPLYNEYFEPCSNNDIIRRMLTNLIGSFQLVGNNRRVKELTELRDILGG